MAEKNDVKIEKTVMFPTGTVNVTSYLMKLQTTQSRVILFSASGSDAAVVYQYASTLSMTKKGFIWIVTQQAISGQAKSKVPQENDSIIWPGGQNTTPKGVFVSNHLRVVTLVGEPFVSVQAVPDSGKCEDLNKDNKKHVLCTGKAFGSELPPDVRGRNQHCCYGNGLIYNIHVLCLLQ
ncbi:Glutamate receptor ionotropic, NMDA 1 [Exaiptasia diaphana]|nr:Glutamate receptor ionotropic, NMDA 1 [Exaiptasia diaphana]